MGQVGFELGCLRQTSFITSSKNEQEAFKKSNVCWNCIYKSRILNSLSHVCFTSANSTFLSLYVPLLKKRSNYQHIWFWESLVCSAWYIFCTMLLPGILPSTIMLNNAIGFLTANKTDIDISIRHTAKMWFWCCIFNMGVSKNNGAPKSSILIGFSIINQPFWGTPIFGNIHMIIFGVCLLLQFVPHVHYERKITCISTSISITSVGWRGRMSVSKRIHIVNLGHVRQNPPVGMVNPPWIE